jgi:hypothetical protein
MPLESLLDRPTSAVLYGSDRPLLNWVAYALASADDPGFHWTDVRLAGEVLAETDPLSLGVIPPDRLNIRYPHELLPNDADANMAIAGVVRGDDTSDAMRRLMDFIRLPVDAQRLLAQGPAGGRPRVFVLSNGHRLVSSYPPNTLASVLGAIVGAGAAMFMTFADSPPASHVAFQSALYLHGHDPKAWKQATLKVERGPSSGPLQAGREYRLDELEVVASVLARHRV